jgi:hypothetical protein
MSPIRPLTASRFVKIFLYGEPGVGKTRFVGSSGEGTLILRPPTDHTDSIIGAPVEEWVIHDWTEMNEALEYLRLEGKKHSWVWLDSISLWQEIGLDDIWQAEVQRKPSRKEYGRDKGEYGRNMERLAEWVRHVVGADAFNFGITAHVFEGETLDGELKYMPYVQGKNMSQKIQGYMNIVAYLEKKRNDQGKVTRTVLHTDESENWVAKDQFNALAGQKGRIIRPTVPELMKFVDAARAKAQPASRPRRSRRRPTTKE